MSVLLYLFTNLVASVNVKLLKIYKQVVYDYYILFCIIILHSATLLEFLLF